MRNKLSPSQIRQKKNFTIFDMKYLWSIFIGHKKWFATSVILCLFMAGVYIYFTPPSYNILGKMMIISRRQTNSSSISAASSALLNQLPSSLAGSLNMSSGTNVENEKEILKTLLLAEDVVKDMELHTEYRLKRFLKSRLLYKNQPVNVKVSPECLQTMSENLPLKVYSINLTIEKSDVGYTVEGKLRKGKKKIEIEEKTFAKLPAIVHTDIGDLTLTENFLPEEEDRKLFEKDYLLKIRITPPMIVAKQYLKHLTIASATKKATAIIHISLQDEDIMRGIDFVNSLVAHYNERSNQERQDVAAKNEEFINGRIAKINEELGLTDSDWEKVKRLYQVTDPRVDAEEVMGKKSSYEFQIVNFGVQLQLLDYLTEYVKDSVNRYELIPINMGAYSGDAVSITSRNNQNVGAYSGDAVSIISRHNQLVNERKMLLKSVTERSKQVMLTTQLIDELHPMILKAFKRDRESLLLKKNVAEREYNHYLSRVGNVPEQERNLTEVSRQRTIKQSVFVSLLQKREEVAMELANTIDKGRLIDETQKLKKTKPKTLVALMASLIAGMLIPYVFLFSRRSMKKQIESEIDLKITTKVPLVGTIPKLRQGNLDVAFRTFHNNLLHQFQEGQKIILFTSADEGDGKTFCAANLARAFAKTGGKTALCDLNFSHPSLAKEFGLSDQTGLVTLFQYDDIWPADIEKSAHPLDLLAHKSLRKAMKSLCETYDIVILDGPAGKPSEMPVDGLADVVCFVCKSGKTSKTAIEEFESKIREDSQSSSCVVLNLF